MSSKLERIYWLEFLRHRLLAPIAYDRRHNGYWGYRLTDDSFELPSYWFTPPTLLFLAAACNQPRHLEGGSFGVPGRRICHSSARGW
jgi:hypothetical protein